MAIYREPENAEYIEKKPGKAQIQTASIEKMYTREEIQKMIETVQNGVN